jgi:SAM-dependent methyltransferase
MEDALFDAMYRDADRHWWFRARWRIVFSLLDRCHAPGGRVLDLGCGVGIHLKLLSRYGEVWGADSSPKALEYCRRRFQGRLDQVELPDRAPYPDASFDLIVMFDVLEHIQDDAAALRRVARLLNPGGILALTVPALPGLWSQHDVEHQHFRRYLRPGLRSLLQDAGLRILKLSYMNTFLLPAMAASRAFLRPATYSARDLSPGTRGPARILEFIFASERHWLKLISFPLGGSLVAICRKPQGKA